MRSICENNAEGAKERLPAGACPPLVSIFSFGGDDISSLSSESAGRKEAGRRWLDSWANLALNFGRHLSLDRQRGFFLSIVWKGSVMASPSERLTRGAR